MSGQASKFWGTVLALGLVGMALIFLFSLMEASQGFNNPMPFFTGIIGGAIFFAVLWGPIGRTIAHMLEGQVTVDDQIAQRVEQLEAQVSEPDYDRQRLAELEDRLDFAERLLARRDDVQAIRPPEVN